MSMLLSLIFFNISLDLHRPSSWSTYPERLWQYRRMGDVDRTTYIHSIQCCILDFLSACWKIGWVYLYHICIYIKQKLQTCACISTFNLFPFSHRWHDILNTLPSRNFILHQVSFNGLKKNSWDNNSCQSYMYLFQYTIHHSYRFCHVQIIRMPFQIIIWMLRLAINQKKLYHRDRKFRMNSVW